VVLLGRVDAGTTPAATNSQWVFQTSVDVTLLLLLHVWSRPARWMGFNGKVSHVSRATSTLPGTLSRAIPPLILLGVLRYSASIYDTMQKRGETQKVELKVQAKVEGKLRNVYATSTICLLSTLSWFVKK
jgi:hypothetical protein